MLLTPFRGASASTPLKQRVHSGLQGQAETGERKEWRSWNSAAAGARKRNHGHTQKKPWLSGPAAAFTKDEVDLRKSWVRNCQFILQHGEAQPTGSTAQALNRSNQHESAN